MCISKWLFMVPPVVPIDKIVSGSVFVSRRANSISKDETNELERWASIPIFGAQFYNLAANIATLNNGVGKSFTSLVNAVEMAKQNPGILGTSAKGLTFIGSNINPALGVHALVRAVCSDDKVEGLSNHGVGYLGMLAGEKSYRKIFQVAKIDECINKIPNAKVRGLCKVLEGVGFVATSLGSMGGSSKLGVFVCDKLRGVSKEKEMIAAKVKQLEATLQAESKNKNASTIGVC